MSILFEILSYDAATASMVVSFYEDSEPDRAVVLNMDIPKDDEGLILTDRDIIFVCIQRCAPRHVFKRRAAIRKHVGEPSAVAALESLVGARGSVSI